MNSLSLKHSHIVMQKLLDAVDGGKWEDFDFSKPQWFWDYEWTEEEEEKFVEWLAMFLRKHKYARAKKKYRGIDEGIYKARKLVVNYGWKVKKDKL